MLKALNNAVRPTSKRETAVANRDAIRDKYGLARPNDPARTSVDHHPDAGEATPAPQVAALLAPLQRSRPGVPASVESAPRPRAQLPSTQASSVPMPPTPSGQFSRIQEAKAQMAPRMALYDECMINLQDLMDQGVVKSSVTLDAIFDQLVDSRSKLGALHRYVQEGNVNSKENPLQEPLLLQKMLIAEMDCRKALTELVIALPGDLVPLIHNADLLNILASNINEELNAAKKDFAKSAPEVLSYIDHVKASLMAEVGAGMQEAQLHHDMLTTQGAAIEGFAQSGIDAHRHSMSGFVGRHAGKQVRQAASHAGLASAVKPEEYAAGMRAELGTRFGRLFDVAVQGEHQVDIRLKPGAEGYFSTPELLEIMETMNNYVGRSRDRNAMEAFIKGSPDIEWATDDGERRLQLTPQARERLGISDTEGLPEAPAQERMQTAVIGGAQGVKLSELKASIMQTFSPDLEKLGQRALSPFNLNSGLTHGKAVLTQTLVEDLMTAPTAEKMLALVDQAIQEHGTLWQADRFARDGGKTATLLTELRASLQRYLAA